MTQLCDFPTEQGNDCCAPTPPPPSAPIRPANVPNLQQIAYRIGTFGSFRRAMLDALATILPGWRPSESGPDYATAFVELWAYIADVLTFYQERIANEAYIGTATQRDSLLRLAQLIDYRASPGAAAGAVLAFKLGTDKTATVNAGLRVSSKPSAGHPAAIFETADAIHAIAAHNAIDLATRAQANQFVTLTPDVVSLLGGTVPTDPVAASAALTALFPMFAGVLGGTGGAPTSGALALGGGSGLTQTRSVVFQGLNLRLRPGDWLLIMAQLPVTRQITASVADPVSKTTTVTWLEEPQYAYSAAWVADPEVYAFRAQALPFGHDAPDTPTQADTITGITTSLLKQIGNEQGSWRSWYVPAVSSTGVVQSGPPSSASQLNALGGAGPSSGMSKQGGGSGGTAGGSGGTAGGSGGGSSSAPTLPEDSTVPNVLHLDRALDGIAPSTSVKSKLVLITPPTVGSPNFYAYDVQAVSKVTHLNYGISGYVTELSLDPAITTQVPARDTTVLVRSEQLKLANDLPLPDPIDGAVVLLKGLYGQLAPGQRVVLQGTRIDTGAVDAEDGLIESVATDAATNTTRVFLHQPLGNRYKRAGALLMANVAAASQGEKVKDDVLGSGDGSPWQTYTLRKSPLTYVQAPAQSSEAAVVTTLQVIVDGVMWSEEPNLLDAGRADRVYITREDAAGKTSVMFGDGSTGARPPTGKDNIHARYRKGLGEAGNVGANAIAQLVDSVPGVDSVRNPEPAVGGADAESEPQIRVNAPAKLRTFNRAVSLDDYANVALAFPGVAMASADWQALAAASSSGAGRLLPRPVVRLTIGLANGRRLSTQADYAARLRRYLDNRRDANVPLLMRDYDPVYVDFAATIDVDDAYGRQATLRAALAAMNYRANPDGSPAFFASFRFGQSVHLSAVYAALQSVTGVKAATVTTLRQVPVDADPNLVRTTIPVGASALAVIANDPADVNNAQGKLVLTLGTGGFAD